MLLKSALLVDRRSTTLFAWTGRALPLPQLLVYMCYVFIVGLCIHYRWPNYVNNNELRGLAAPLGTMGEAQQLCTPVTEWWQLDALLILSPDTSLHAVHRVERTCNLAIAPSCFDTRCRSYAAFMPIVSRCACRY
jgi:hypothetical protein